MPDQVGKKIAANEARSVLQHDIRGAGGESRSYGCSGSSDLHVPVVGDMGVVTTSAEPARQTTKRMIGGARLPRRFGVPRLESHSEASRDSPSRSGSPKRAGCTAMTPRAPSNAA